MRRLLLKRSFWARSGAAALAGSLLALAFPNFEIAGLAWIAPGLLLLAGGSAGRGQAFRTGYLGGLVFYLLSLYWLLLIPMKFMPVVGWLALSLYLAVYPALWVRLSWKLYPAKMPAPVLDHPFRPEFADWLFSVAWPRRALWALQCAALWVGLEMILGRFLSGFPWDFVGVSQYKLLPLIQISAYTGVYGVSFLVIWFAVSFWLGGIGMVQPLAAKNRWMRECALPLLVITILSVAGFQKIRNFEKPDREIKAVLIQPSIPQTLIWDEKENHTRFQQLMNLSERALQTQPDLLIWPEASVPNMLRHHPETAEAVRQMAREHQVWAILGSDDAELRDGTQQVDYFNSAFAVSPEGELAARYRKRRLVIFGEYIPFVQWLPFLKILSPAGESGFTPGREVVPFHLDNLDVLTSVLICFEDTFPHLVREYVKPETSFLVNLTNNGWFGESAAQWQHAATAAFRAVENNIPLVRCANNGLSCWVDSVGRMHAIYFPEDRNIYRAGYKLVRIPISPVRELTFYTRYGDIFGWSCLGVTVLSLSLGFYRSRTSGGVVT